jgi:hypothetical protein
MEIMTAILKSEWSWSCELKAAVFSNMMKGPAFALVDSNNDTQTFRIM